MQSKLQLIIADYIDGMASEAAALTTLVRHVAAARAARHSILSLLEDEMDANHFKASAQPISDQSGAARPEERLHHVIKDLERSVTTLSRRNADAGGHRSR